MVTLMLTKTDEKRIVLADDAARDEGVDSLMLEFACVLSLLHETARPKWFHRRRFDHQTAAESL